MVSCRRFASIQRHHYNHQGMPGYFFQRGSFHLRLVNKDYAAIVPKVIRWLQIDFTPLREPQLGYKNQKFIDPYRVEMASAAMIHFGLDPGKFVRFLSREYTGQMPRRSTYCGCSKGSCQYG